MIAVKAVFHKLITGKTSDEFLLHHAGQYKTHQPQRNNYDDIPNDTLGQTQNLNQDTQDDLNGPAMQTMAVNQTDHDEIEVEKRMYNDVSNFQSAPLNAQSAFLGNKELEERNRKF